MRLHDDEVHEVGHHQQHGQEGSSRIKEAAPGVPRRQQREGQEHRRAELAGMDDAAGERRQRGQQHMEERRVKLRAAGGRIVHHVPAADAAFVPELLGHVVVVPGVRHRGLQVVDVGQQDQEDGGDQAEGEAVEPVQRAYAQGSARPGDFVGLNSRKDGAQTRACHGDVSDLSSRPPRALGRSAATAVPTRPSSRPASSAASCLPGRPAGDSRSALR